MSQIADVKCVIFELAYQEALDMLYQMNCSNAQDLNSLVMYSYKKDGGCTDEQDDCCAYKILQKYDIASVDCNKVNACSTDITLAIAPPVEIYLL